MITITKQPPLIALCDNTMNFEFTTDLSPEEYENIRIHATAIYENFNTGLDEESGTDILFPPTSGPVNTDLREYLRIAFNNLNYFPIVLPESILNPFTETLLSKYYKIKIEELATEISSSIDAIISTTWITDVYILRGKIPKWKWAQFYSQYTSFYNWINTNPKPFLTFAPKTQIIKVNQIQKLYYPILWEPAEDERLKLRLNLVFTDGSTATFITNESTGNLHGYKYAIIQFSVGYNVLNLEQWVATNHPGKTIYSYSVTATSSGIAVSETRTYIVDRNSAIGQRQFLFSNSVGGYDSLLATGRNELTSNYTYDTVRQQSPGIQALAEKKQLNVDELNIHTCRTGYFNAEMAEYIAEFFLSEERYEISGSTLIPIILENSKVLRKRDSENEFYAEFDYQHALNQKVEVG